MQAAVLKISHDRNTGKKISEEVMELIEVDEEKYYAPLVKVLGDDFIKKWKEGKYHD